MNTIEMTTATEVQAPKTGTVDFKLEVVVVPVADVDRAKRFYTSLGWREDIDVAGPQGYRALHMTPTGSTASILIGNRGVTSAEPGSVAGLLLAVEDIDAARAELISRGVDVSEVFHDAGGSLIAVPEARAAGHDPEGRSYATYASFSDPDGNRWLLQEEDLGGRVRRDVVRAQEGVHAGCGLLLDNRDQIVAHRFLEAAVQLQHVGILAGLDQAALGLGHAVLQDHDDRRAVDRRASPGRPSARVLREDADHGGGDGGGDLTAGDHRAPHAGAPDTRRLHALGCPPRLDHAGVRGWPGAH